MTKGFWLADTACTQGLWEMVMGNKPGYFKGAQLPVESVSWEDVLDFIQEINKLEPGLDLRLPTEAEWEYACRAGTETPFCFGENITPEQVNYEGRFPYAGGKSGIYRRKTVAVKSLPCNGWGLYEMHGNIWEWCSDWYGKYPRGSSIDPVGPINGATRVLRGGSWLGNGCRVRSACRNKDVLSNRCQYVGFRLARD